MRANTSYVVGLLFHGPDDDRSLIMVHKMRGPSFNIDRLNGVGGKVENGEFPMDAMVREFHEETGVLVPAASWSWFLTLNVSGATPESTVVFYRSFIHAEPSWRTAEDERIYSVPLRTISTSPETWLWHDMAFSQGLAWQIPMALNSKAKEARVTEYHDVCRTTRVTA